MKNKDENQILLQQEENLNEQRKSTSNSSITEKSEPIYKRVKFFEKD